MRSLGLGSLPSSSDLESEWECSDFELEQNEEYKINGWADGNLPFGLRSYNVSEFSANSAGHGTELWSMSQPPLAFTTAPSSAPR